MTSATIADLANLGLALSFIAGLIFGVAQVREATRDRKERFSLDALRNFRTREFAELIQYITNRNLPADQEGLRALPVHEQVYFIQLGQEMETLGILVADGLVDIDVVDKTLGSFVSTSWEKYAPLVLNMRVTAADPYLSEYFQWLARVIDTRMRENPRKPFMGELPQKAH